MPTQCGLTSGARSMPAIRSCKPWVAEAEHGNLTTTPPDWPLIFDFWGLPLQKSMGPCLPSLRRFLLLEASWSQHLQLSSGLQKLPCPLVESHRNSSTPGLWELGCFLHLCICTLLAAFFKPHPGSTLSRGHCDNHRASLRDFQLP